MVLITRHLLPVFMGRYENIELPEPVIAKMTKHLYLNIRVIAIKLLKKLSD